MSRVVGYKLVQSDMGSRWRSGMTARLRWAMPGGETALPRVWTAGPEVEGHRGPGLYAARTQALARLHINETFTPRLLIVDTDERDITYQDLEEIRASRWRTLAVLPQEDTRERFQSHWYHFGEGMHGTEHAWRVQHWAWLIGGTLACNWGVDMKALTYAALLHDSGRGHDGLDSGHGVRAARKVTGILREEDVDLTRVRYLCEWHEVGHTGSPPVWTPELLALQDADALDLYRCMSEIDLSRLHTDAARALAPYAKLWANYPNQTCPLLQE